MLKSNEKHLLKEIKSWKMRNGKEIQMNWEQKDNTKEFYWNVSFQT